MKSSDLTLTPTVRFEISRFINIVLGILKGYHTHIKSVKLDD